MTTHLTFAQLEEQYGTYKASNVGDTALDRWYRSVRDKPFDKFSDEDFSRAVRQQLRTEHILPFVVERLKERPLAGELYEGELLNALSELPRQFWSENESLRHQLRNFLASMETHADLSQVKDAVVRLSSALAEPS
jgi:hypothetical protein